MKRVSFEVAKAIKDAGYPQDIQEVYKENGEYFVSYIKYSNTFAAPTYLDVWLWLWREKRFTFNVEHFDYSGFRTDILQGQWFSDPEEVIKSAIEYLVTNDLIK